MNESFLILDFFFGSTKLKHSFSLHFKIPTMTKNNDIILAPAQGSISHFVLTTIPILGLLIYFLYEAAIRPQKSFYNLGDDFTDDEYEAASSERSTLISLNDMLIVFLILHIFWTIFVVYVVIFIPKRRHLIGSYLRDGQETLGDIIYDRNSRKCSGFHDYGYAIYPHPTRRTLIRKRVRVYQPYTRERVTILRLPGLPLSGQAKIDIEVDLSAASQDRDSRNKSLTVYSIFWYFFTLLGSIFLLHQMKQTDHVEGYHSTARKLLFLIIGLNIPISYVANMTRFLLFRNWMTNRGAIIDNSDDARKIVDTSPGSCLWDEPSVDGSDVIPYNIMNDEGSYDGSLQGHDLNNKPPEQEGKKAWVTV